MYFVFGGGLGMGGFTAFASIVIWPGPMSSTGVWWGVGGGGLLLGLCKKDMLANPSGPEPLVLLILAYHSSQDPLVLLSQWVC